MKFIPPRQRHLLNILAFTDAPISINELAKRLSVSRRTIFREIEGIDRYLHPYALNIDSKMGEGVYLHGQSTDILTLRKALEQKTHAPPAGRYERRVLLTIELLTSPESQKLYYFANQLKVSEATISQDLDALEEKLEKFGIHILRKSGQLVTLTGSETAIRSAIIAILTETERNDTPFLSVITFPPEDISAHINQLMVTRFVHQLGWMTAESRDVLAQYMAVAVARITSHNEIDAIESEIPTRFLPIADFFANSLEVQFSIVFSEWERKNLAVYLAASRQSAHLGVIPGETTNDYMFKSYAYRMIEHFDPALAPFLKLDDRLVDGLALHLQSTIVRIQNHVVLDDPLFEGIARAYPDMLAKSKQALTVLAEFAADIAETEASFLATHFGAGVMRIREHGNRRRLRVGVICAGGIGTSYFMASQIKKHFASQAEIEICGLGEVEDWQGFDLCVSSIPLSGISIPVVLVSQLLKEADIDAIRQHIEQIPAHKNKAAPVPVQSLLETCENAAAILRDTASILSQFSTVTIERDCDFDHLAKLAGYRFGETEESGRLIYDDLIKREALSTQVVPELSLILLHARTTGVSRPVFSLIVPDGERFTAPALQNSRCCVVMLAPMVAERDMLNMIGKISTALLEDPVFLEVVLIGDKERVYRGLEEILKGYLSEHIVF